MSFQWYCFFVCALLLLLLLCCSSLLVLISRIELRRLKELCYYNYQSGKILLSLSTLFRSRSLHLFSKQLIVGSKSTKLLAMLEVAIPNSEYNLSDEKEREIYFIINCKWAKYKLRWFLIYITCSHVLSCERRYVLLLHLWILIHLRAMPLGSQESDQFFIEWVKNSREKRPSQQGNIARYTWALWLIIIFIGDTYFFVCFNSLLCIIVVHDFLSFAFAFLSASTLAFSRLLALFSHKSHIIFCCFNKSRARRNLIIVCSTRHKITILYTRHSRVINGKWLRKK